MPPHCDSMDGPVVTAARAAIAARDVDRVLPYVTKDREAEVVAAFDRAIAARDASFVIDEVADLYFFETVVRLHLAGEGKPFTGLKPAGLPVGPVIPVAERAIESGDPTELIALLVDRVTRETEHRFREIAARRPHPDDGVDARRAYVDATLGLQRWAHAVYGAIRAGSHLPNDQEHAPHPTDRLRELVAAG